MRQLSVNQVVKSEPVKESPKATSRDYWSDCGQVFFTGGKGYGLTPELRTICLGKEDDIKKFLDAGELDSKFTPTAVKVLEGILEYRKEQGIGATVTRAADMERAGNNGASRHKPKATRLLTPRKRLPLRPSRTKGKSLSCK